MLLRFKDLYNSVAIPKLTEEFGYKNIHEIPFIKKVVLNIGCGEAVSDSKALDHAVTDLMAIGAQKPLITKAKKSIATFKLREGMNIGCKVTIRSDRMYHFLERLIMIALPRVRNFNGFALKNFDGAGNLNLGIPDHSVFLEISYDKIYKPLGLDVSIVTSAKTNREGKSLLSHLNFPFC